MSGFYGQFINTAPVVEGTVEGSGLYDYVDMTTGQTVGTFDGTKSLLRRSVDDHDGISCHSRTYQAHQAPGAGNVPAPGSSHRDLANLGNTETIYPR